MFQIAGRFIAVAFLLMTPGVLFAHSISMIQGEAVVSRDKVELKLDIKPEDILLSAGITAFESDPISRTDIVRGVQAHRSFLLAGVIICDSDGGRLTGRITQVDMPPVPDAGVPVADFMAMTFVYRVEYPLVRPPPRLSFQQQFDTVKTGTPVIMEMKVTQAGRASGMTIPIPAGDQPETVTFDWTDAAQAAPMVGPSRSRIAARYLTIGFEHILPNGLDHILFVLGLFLLGSRLRPLLWQVTAFTLAHSITLGLSLYGVFRLPPSVVEPLIALSIAFVAVENICTSELKPWRPFVVFGFGLVHGLGFAGALTSLGLPRNEFATALVTFNVGVEMGQLTVIALAFAAVGWWRQRKWYRPLIMVPASVLIAATGLFWTVQRVMQSA